MKNSGALDAGGTGDSRCLRESGSTPARSLAHLSRILRLGLSAFLLAVSLLTAGAAFAQAAPSVSLQVVFTGFDDNDASGSVTLGDRLHFTSTATNTGNIPLTNVHITDSFDAVGVTCANVPPATGNTCTLLSSHIVNQADVDTGSVTDTSTVTSNETAPVTSNSGSGISNPPALTAVSGNNQIVQIGVPSAPLSVQLTNNNLPVANAVITWTANAGATLAHPTSTTDASGIATNTATLHHPGPATVSADSASPAAGPVKFTLNAGLIHVSGLTPGEIEVANALDHACPALAAMDTLSPDQQDLLDQCQAIAAVAGQNPAKVADVLNQLLPHDALLQTSASVLVTTAQFDNVKSRLASLRSGGGGDHFGGLAFTSPDGMLPVGSLGNALLGFGDDKDKKEVGADFERWGFFASGSFSRGGADARVATPGYGFHTHGLTAGVDYRYNDHMVFGVSAGYNNYSSEVDFVGGGMDTHGWSLSAYGTLFQQDSWYSDAVLTYGNSTYDINRRIVYTITTGGVNVHVNQTAKSNSDGHTFAGAFTFGRDFSSGPWSYGPYVREQFSRTDFGSYREVLVSGQAGSGLGLSVDGRRSVSLQSVLGGKVNYAASTSWGVVMPHAELEWLHEFKDNPDAINASFLQDPTATQFQLVGDPLDTDFFKLGIGMSFVFPHGKSGFFYVERTLGLSGVTQSNISIGFRMEF